MKKFIIPIAIAVVLGIGGGIAAVMLSRGANSEIENNGVQSEVIVPELKSGNYYLNGDIERDLYLEVTEDHISLKSADLVAEFKKVILAEWEEKGYEDIGEEKINSSAEEYAKEYSPKNPYVISVTGIEEVPYAVLIHWNGTDASTYTGSGYWFNGVDTLNLSWFGDFILVDSE
ncbi:MAG: hypothetical protein J1F09_01290 [Oscillospiraceae bacterium]|nr:hypothetical protein [Oscillospiraceae bacterium]